MLDKKSPLPLYHQLRTVIEDRIESGEWPPAAQVPSERELCEQFGVSRITVRQALADLVNAGRLVRDHGRGTFVAQPRVEQRLNQLTSFTQDMRARGLQPGTRVLNMEVIPASPAVARALCLEVGALVFQLKRLRLANHEPLALEAAHLPQDLCPGLSEEPLEDRSLYELLTTKFHLTLARAEQIVEALACPADVAACLGVRRGKPVLHMTRVTYHRDGRPFEYTESFYRGDKHFFRVELRNE